MKKITLTVFACTFFSLSIFFDVFADVPTYPDLSALSDLPYSYSGDTYADRIVYLSSRSIWVSIDYKEGTDFNPSTFNTGGYWEIASGAQCMGAARCLLTSTASNFRQLFWYGNEWITNPPSPYNYTALNISEQWEDSIIWSTKTFLFIPYVSRSYCRQLPPNWDSYCHDDVINSIVNPPIEKQLSIVLDPVAGGGVSDYPAGENIYCGIDGYEICQALFEPNTEITLNADPKDDWAFAFWDNGIACLLNNPLTLSMNGNENLTLTAKFFKTFRCVAGDFYADIGDTGGECVPYVRYETGIPPADFNGEADTTFQQAIDNGYATGSEPRESAIIVFAAQGNMTVGHVGIVTVINGSNITMRDSNWSLDLDGKIREHIVDISNYDILGYIYCTFPN